ncbi:hypothetical protein ACIO7M_20090 [Streptomyces toxytricini]|uniref:Uncharacterized protein n=1 Tax=Streptomyces toxytricini TaxID=67369 RepID=A0ABW8EJH8_STRT5
MLALPPAAGGADTVHELPLPAGSTHSSVQAMNDAGDVVGLAYGDDGTGRLVRWGADGTPTLLQGAGGGSGGSAAAVAEDGTVAGAADTPDGVRHPARWDGAGRLTRLEEPSGFVEGEVRDVNDSRIAVGHLSTGSTALPARWGADGRAVLLRLPARATGGTATGINERGEITGHVSLPEDRTRAVRWDRMGRVHDLGSLGGAYAEPSDINDRGTVVGLATDAGGTWKAVQAPRGSRLKALPSQEAGARGVHVNDSDVAVGNVKDRSLRWSGGTAVELRWLSSAGPTSVKGLNDAGTSIGTSGARAVTWDAQGRATALPVPAGADRAEPVAINGAGVVAGNAAAPGTWPVRWRAVVWR